MLTMNPIFVVGSGRSGTHLLAEQLSQRVPGAMMKVESNETFYPATYAAVRGQSIPAEVIEQYMQWLDEAKQAGRVLIVKDHPNLFFTLELFARFPEAGFVYARRHRYGILSSMLRHCGCLSWNERWREWPESPFLGNPRSIAGYGDYPMEFRIGVRLAAHQHAAEEAQRQLDDSFLVWQYELNADRSVETWRSSLAKDQMRLCDEGMAAFRESL